jgi:hypothetical protein
MMNTISNVQHRTKVAVVFLIAAAGFMLPLNYDSWYDCLATNHYIGVCSLTNAQSFTLQQNFMVTHIRVWYDTRIGGDSLHILMVEPDGSQNIFDTVKFDCSPYQYWLCEGMIEVNRVLEAGTYTLTSDSVSMCSDPNGITTMVVYGYIDTGGNDGDDSSGFGNRQAYPPNPLVPVDMPIPVNPEANPVTVGACPDVLIRPMLQVPAADVGQMATLIMYIYFPVAGFGINIPPRQATLTAVTECNLVPTALDFSDVGGFSFHVYYGYVIGANITYSAYAVTVGDTCGDTDPSTVLNCAAFTSQNQCDAISGCTWQPFPFPTCILDCASQTSESACNAAFGGGACQWASTLCGDVCVRNTDNPVDPVAEPEPVPECTAQNFAACSTVTACEAAGGYWYDDRCNELANCRAGNESGCDTSITCVSIGGNWWDDACHDEPDPAAGCSRENLSACTDSVECQMNGGMWYDDGVCRARECSEWDVGLCETEAACIAVGGTWTGTYCTTAAFTGGCSAANPAGCTDPVTCMSVGGVWVNDACRGSSSDFSCNDCSCSEYAITHPDECGRTADLNFRLTWNDTNDVDIHVVYDSGAISEEIYRNERTGFFSLIFI